MALCLPVVPLGGLAFLLCQSQCENRSYVRFARLRSALSALIVMRDQKLIEKHAKEIGLDDVQVIWTVLDGGNVINDAMLASNLDVAGIGVPGFLTLWAKARGIPGSEVIGLSALSTSSLALNTTNPRIRSLRDFGPKDKIAVPGIKTSLSAVVLRMAAAKTFGVDNYGQLDALTVSMSHPEAMAALLSDKSEITAHLTSPPFSYEEALNPRVHVVFDSADLLGKTTLDVVFASKRFVETNPKLIAAFLAAQEEANAFIATNRRAAAEIFVRTGKLRLPIDDVDRMLNTKRTQFSTTPNGIMQFAQFMSDAGTIKTRPSVWSDPFVSSLKSKPGS